MIDSGVVIASRYASWMISPVQCNINYIISPYLIDLYMKFLHKLSKHSIGLFDIFIMWGTDTCLIQIFRGSGTADNHSREWYSYTSCMISPKLIESRFLINYFHKFNLNIRHLTHEACEAATRTRSRCGFSPDPGQLCDNHWRECLVLYMLHDISIFLFLCH